MHLPEKQLTYTPQHHFLPRYNAWSIDSQWVFYVIRADDAPFTANISQRVNIATCEVDTFNLCDRNEKNCLYQQGFVGTHGYTKADGTVQRYAFPFIDNVKTANDTLLPELFFVDFPDSFNDEMKISECTLTRNGLAHLPAGILPRRLTYTENRRYPGVLAAPQRQICSSPDGSKIAFLMKDAFDVVQMWVVSPLGGEIRQVTEGEHSVDSAFSWSPDGRNLAFVMDRSVVLCDVNSGVVRRLSEKRDDAPSADVIAFSPNGEYVVYQRIIDTFQQLFIVPTQEDA